MVMALFVLLGFGVLFLFAMDEGLQGGERSIESVIAQQARDIESIQNQADAGQKTLALAPARLKTAKDLSRLAHANEAGRGNIEVLGKTLAAGKAELARRTEAFAVYKDQYRAHVRGKAKGQTLETLQTKSGAVYKNVNIREVTAVGIQIRHEEGQKRIPFEELPEAMKDHFQFDPQQKAAAIVKEQANWNEHEAAVSASDSASELLAAEQAKAEANVQKEKAIRSLAIMASRIGPLAEEIEALEKAIPLEREKRFSRARQMREQLAAKQRQLAALQAEIARIEAGQ